MKGGSVETVGENKEFTLASIQDVTIYFNGGSNGTNTSANDTATEKYFDTNGAVSAFCLRPNQTVQIISINGLTFTDPITVIINKSYTDHYESPLIFKMVIRPTVVGTSIKLRIKGR